MPDDKIISIAQTNRDSRQYRAPYRVAIAIDRLWHTFPLTGLSARGGATREHAGCLGLAFHEGGACRRFVDHAARRPLRPRSA